MQCGKDRRFVRNTNPKHSIFNFIMVAALLFTAPLANAEEYTLLDAVRITLKNQPSILIQEQQKEAVGGQLQQAAGVFDPTVGANISRISENTPLAAVQRDTYKTDELKTTKTSYSVEGAKQFRSGISIKPSITATRNDDSSISTDPIGNGSVSFSVSIPLLQGLGLNTAAATELATMAELKAARLDVYDRVARDVLDTGTAYWTLLATQQQLEIMRESETTAEKTVADYTRLAEGDKFPSSDVDLFRANLAYITSARLSAEQQAVAARYNLALAMGILSANEALGSVSARSTFPLPQTNEPHASMERDLFKLASRNRSDLQASRYRETSGEFLIQGARNSMKPKLDFLLSGGYNGLSEENDASDYYRPLYDNLGGFNSTLSLRYQFPVGNNSAKGDLRIKTAQYNIAVLRSKDLEKNIFAAVRIAESDLEKSRKDVAVMEKTVNLFQKVYDNEKRKLLAGISTVLDVIQTEERQRDARIRLILARQKYAAAILRIRFETGTLITFDKGSERIDIEQLVSAPGY
ncbi:MAG: TolC family protein [Kiritimatiellae bacterium]|nr:TolC family protein [Kiritimatiellia bacterium]MDD5521991.1 TolC family protein [Kiritimatiellia bacterium]